MDFQTDYLEGNRQDFGDSNTSNSLFLDSGILEQQPINTAADTSNLTQSTSDADFLDFGNSEALYESASSFGKGSNDGSDLPGDHVTERLNVYFGQVLNQMRDEGRHLDGVMGGWLQNTAEERKCYNQADYMIQNLRELIKQDPVLSEMNLEFRQAVINEGLGSNPVDFWTGNGEHNFISVHDMDTGKVYFADPWSSTQFTTDPERIPGARNEEINEYRV